MFTFLKDCVLLNFENYFYIRNNHYLACIFKYYAFEKQKYSIVMTWIVSFISFLWLCFWCQFKQIFLAAYLEHVHWFLSDIYDSMICILFYNLFLIFWDLYPLYLLYFQWEFNFPIYFYYNFSSKYLYILIDASIKHEHICVCVHFSVLYELWICLLINIIWSSINQLK